MARETVTRTAPGWEERTLTLLPVGERERDGAGAMVAVRDGFVRLALLLEVERFGGGPGLRIGVERAGADGRWKEVAAVTADEPGPQVVWVEIPPATDGERSAALRAWWRTDGFVHEFSLDVVAIYRREEPEGRAAR